MSTTETLETPKPAVASSGSLGRDRAIRALLEEVMWWHSDPTLGEYNGCDTDPCLWCECAKGLLAGTMNHDAIVESIGRPNTPAQRPPATDV